MLDFLGTIAITATMVVVFNALLATLPVPRLARLGLAAAVGVFIGLSVALGASGEYSDAGRRVFPMIGAMFAVPLVATGTAALLLPRVRTALLALPLPLLIGLNLPRIFGGFFLLLAADGRLGGPFPHYAGWGDVLTGVLALPVALLAATAATDGRQWIVGAWNAFGVLDLVVAVTLGVVSSPGSPLQVVDAGVGSAAVQHLPWALIPTVLVPAWLIVHGVIFAQLRTRAVATGARISVISSPAH
jgi:hypothetical protein